MSDEDWLKIPYDQRVAICVYIFGKIVEDGGGSFRKLIYDKLQFKGASYEKLYLSGGMTITNAISTLRESEYCW